MALNGVQDVISKTHGTTVPMTAIAMPAQTAHLKGVE
jgi:hypothetical protein